MKTVTDLLQMVLLSISAIPFFSVLEAVLELVFRETLDGYLITYEYQTNRIEGFDKRIEELASETEYVEKVKKLVCFLGVKTYTALSCLAEAWDFQRFAKGTIYMGHDDRTHQRSMISESPLPVKGE